jgi:cytochrome c-type biogenesis protein CcmH/NrfG
MEILFAILLLALVAAWVSVPLRRDRRAAERGLENPRLADLEARKQAKYREIRDAELDHAQGKIGDEEFARQDAELRQEAIEILKELDGANGSGGEAPPKG